VARIGAGGGTRVKVPQPNIPPVKVDPVAKPLVQPVVQPSSRTKALGALDKRRAEEAAAKAKAEAAKKTVIMDKGMTDRVGRDPDTRKVAPKVPVSRVLKPPVSPVLKPEPKVVVDVVDKGMTDHVGRDPDTRKVAPKVPVSPVLKPQINGGPRTGGFLGQVVEKSGVTMENGVAVINDREVEQPRAMAPVARQVSPAALPAYQREAMQRAQQIQQQRRAPSRPRAATRGSSARSYKTPQRY